MSSLAILLGWLFDALSLKPLSDAIFARFAGPSDADYPVHRAIQVMCRDGRHEDARRLASSSWEWNKSPRIGRDLIDILLSQGERMRAVKVASEMARHAKSRWPRLLTSSAGKPLSVAQARVLMEKTVPISRTARFIAGPVARARHAGLTGREAPGADPLWVQAALEEAGTLRLLVATVAGLTGRMFGKDRWFHTVAGPQVAEIATVETVDAEVASNEPEPSKEAKTTVAYHLQVVARVMAWAAAAVTVAAETVARYARTAWSNPRTRGLIAGVLLIAVLGTSALAWDEQPPPTDKPAPIPGVTPVPVLLYHDLTADTVSPKGMIVPVQEFVEQMRLLKEQGYEAITATELHAHLIGTGTLPSRPVLITFDDGYESVYTLAYPVLRELGLKATAFVVGTTLRTPNHLTFEHLREMSASGVLEIGSHTYAGHGGTSDAPEIRYWTEEQIAEDLSTLTAVLAAEKVPMAPAFAYPFGDPGRNLESAVRSLGFTIAFTTEDGMAGSREPLLRQKRITVWPGGDGGHFLQSLEPSFWREDAGEET